MRTDEHSTVDGRIKEKTDVPAVNDSADQAEDPELDSIQVMYANSNQVLAGRVKKFLRRRAG